MSTFIVDLMRKHASAPIRWRDGADDGLSPADLAAVRAFEDRISASERDTAVAGAILRDAIATAVERGRAQSSHYRRTLATAAARGLGPESLASLPTTSRAELRAAPESFVPQDAGLERLIVLRSPGASPALIPHHPAAVASDLALLKAALRRRGIRAEFAADVVGVIQVGLGGGSTACELRALDGAGFARLDLGAPDAWRDPTDPVRFIAAFAPPVVLGTIPALDDLARRAEDLARREPGAGKAGRTRAIFATGADVPPALRERLERAFIAPTIEWFGVPEAGPLAFGCKMLKGLHLLPPDIAIEALPSDEIALTGGRNPFLPLIRYKTGDAARLQPGPCACGDPAPRLVGLRRAPTT